MCYDHSNPTLTAGIQMMSCLQNSKQIMHRMEIVLVHENEVYRLQLCVCVFIILPCYSRHVSVILRVSQKLAEITRDKVRDRWVLHIGFQTASSKVWCTKEMKLVPQKHQMTENNEPSALNVMVYVIYMQDSSVKQLKANCQMKNHASNSFFLVFLPNILYMSHTEIHTDLIICELVRCRSVLIYLGTGILVFQIPCENK